MVRKSTAVKRHHVGPFSEPVASAAAAQLRYVSDDGPGIHRRKAGAGFSFIGPTGRAVRDVATIQRIRSLVIPPAWTDVWISPLPNGHLQATGHDARGRKQYRYHPRWRQVRDETKYGRMALFGTALPRIRQRVRDDLALTGFARNRLLATIVRLLEETLIRVGNEEYARSNKSYGLTTMQDRHVHVTGADIQFHFRGKSGKEHAIHVSDPRVARVIAKCRELPGHDLFQYVDDDGKRQPIDSADVNGYLQAISGEEFTAKDYRTWAGSLLAAESLAGTACFDSKRASKKAATAAITSVASHLGNTPAVCRKSYIHPTVLKAYEDEALFEHWVKVRAKKTTTRGLHREETALLRFLAATS